MENSLLRISHISVADLAAAASLASMGREGVEKLR
jgi:hypothetical protein